MHYCHESLQRTSSKLTYLLSLLSLLCSFFGILNSSNVRVFLCSFWESRRLFVSPLSMFYSLWINQIISYPCIRMIPVCVGLSSPSSIIFRHAECTLCQTYLESQRGERVGTVNLAWLTEWTYWDRIADRLHLYTPESPPHRKSV